MQKKKQVGVGTKVPTKHTTRTDSETPVEGSRTLSQEEWDTMSSYKSFVVGSELKGDPESHSQKFFVGNYGIIVPAGSESLVPDLHEHWVGKIKEIRSDPDDNSEVWAKVQWLWSAEDVAEQRKRFDSNLYGKMERFLSNKYDFVHAECFQDLASVVFYDESNIMQPFISEDTFYYRSTYDYKRNHIMGKPSATCLCGVHYDPDKEEKDSIMHFCPRASCKRSYHTSCLRKANSVDESWKNRDSRFKATSTVPRYLQLERMLPHIPAEQTRSPADSVFLTTNATPSQMPPRKRRPSVTASQDTIVNFDTHALIPLSLLALARSPMVKGAGTTLPRNIGVVTGNIAVVARARKLLAHLMESEDFARDNWEESIGLPREDISTWVEEDEGLLCPNCRGAI
ncbi:hypothetical protein EW145_g4545 [Phellinidium pouzarii]|uniref:BAH domain-containing protein n=1 Tax=Phellinidium pouzarii TaxID=167371 RepID=A0A4S4L800_9AGAM|nr:hypothetical protein EW145_g4545 [Phellinidium pouzarii]